MDNITIWGSIVLVAALVVGLPLLSKTAGEGMTFGEHAQVVAMVALIGMAYVEWQPIASTVLVLAILGLVLGIRHLVKRRAR